MALNVARNPKFGDASGRTRRMQSIAWATVVHFLRDSNHIAHIVVERDIPNAQ